MNKPKSHKDGATSVFISHKRGIEIDDRIALLLAQDLKRLGCKVFLDYNQPPAIEIDRELVEHLDKADFVVALISPAADQSEWVKSEIERADSLYIDKGRPRIVPIRIKFTNNYSPRLAVCLNRFSAIYSNGSDYPALLAQVKSALGLGSPIDYPIPVKRWNTRRIKIFGGMGICGFLVLMSFWWLAGWQDNSARIIDPVNEAAPAGAVAPSTPSPHAKSSRVADNSPPTAAESPRNHTSKIRDEQLFESFSNAYNQSQLGASENQERARELYLKALKDVSPAKRATLGPTCSSLLKDAENTIKQNDANGSLTKFNKFFTSCLTK
jgi:hypothetical protein